MRQKKRIEVQGMRPELLFALVVADTVYRENGRDLVVTSVTDGKHSETSLHYSGCAADLRTNVFPEGADLVAKQIRDGLTNDYDVVLESDHIHLEYQPRY